jgi:chitodextrinase
MRDFTRLLIALCAYCLFAVLPKTTFAQPGVPSTPDLPNPIIKLSFDEANGGMPLNTGTASATFVRSNVTPVTSTNVPSQDGNVNSLDFGVTPANYFVESSAIIPELQNLSTFTITGWVNAKSNVAGSGGNRIVSWINNGGDGVDLVMENNGRLRLGVDGWPDHSIAYTANGRITIDPQGGADNWIFFAVTYDSNSGEVKWYIGNNSGTLIPDGGAILQAGAVGSNIAKLAIGAFNSATRNPTTYDRMFRGLIDDIQIYGSVLSFDDLETLFSFNEDATSPDKITNLRIVNTTPTSLTVAWSTPPNSGVTSYDLTMYDLTNGPQSAIALGLVNTFTTFVPLLPGSTQRVILTAFDAAGNSYSAEVTTTLPFEQQADNTLVSLSFNEPNLTFQNAGTAVASFQRSSDTPASNTNTPAGVGGAFSFDFGTSIGNYYASSVAPINELKNLNSFTITGWVNNRSNAAGAGGNRILSWINNGGDGVDLVYQSNGSLRLGIDQWPDFSPAFSSANKVTTNSAVPPANWTFFAVTYQSTTGQVGFYFGDNATNATLDVIRNYPGRGATGTNIAKLAIGAFNDATRNPATYNRMFRGLIDNITVHGAILSPEEIVAVQRRSAVDTTPPPAPTLLTAVNVTTSSATLQWQPPQDQSDIAMYVIAGSVGGVPFSASSSVTPFHYPGLDANTTYTFFIQSKDQAGNLSAPSNTITFTTLSAQSPLIKLSLDEDTGVNPVNLGSLNSSFNRSSGIPVSATVIARGAGSFGFDVNAGDYYVESQGAIDGLKNLSAFTITGWINNQVQVAGSGGNRIVSWINNGGDGVDLVYQSNGSLRLGVDQWPDNSPAFSSPNKVTTLNNPTLQSTNWVFFAVTYQSNGKVEYYFGKTDALATLDVTKSYAARGTTGANIGKLALGNFNSATRNPSTYDRMFRGFMDNIQIYGSALTLEEIIHVQLEDIAVTPRNTSSVARYESETELAEPEEGVTKLFQNYPNPFESETTIDLYVPHSAKAAQIVVRDLSGRPLKNIEVTERGKTSVTLGSGDMNNGMYLYFLWVDGKTLDTKRMAITR